ncbi:Uncharacterised protein [Mycobacteroides abscessus subsp. abscessus]|nr:Uncharacterised protein [Mycobacteroides abscessus subsp. abscessus]
MAGDFVGQNRCAHDGQSGPHTGEQRRSVGGVPDQSHSAPAGVGERYLCDGVEVEVVAGPHGLEKLGGTPSHALEDAVCPVALCGRICPVVGTLGRLEKQSDHQLSVLVHGVAPQGATRTVQQQACVAQAENVTGGEMRLVTTEMANEITLGAKSQGTGT